MAKQTAYMLTPTLEECVHLAKDPEIQLSEREARRFFAHYETRGWRVAIGKTTTPMKSLRQAMVGWKMRNEDREGAPNSNGVKQAPVLTGIEKKIYCDELDRVMRKMKAIRDSYSENMDWRQNDVKDFIELKIRKKVLQGKLGVKF